MFSKKKPAPYKPTPWELAVFETPPKKPVAPALLRKLTTDLARNDVRVVTESVEFVLSSKNMGTRERRRALAEERFAHLETLKPFMDEEQLSMCVPTDEAMKKLRQR